MPQVSCWGNKFLSLSNLSLCLLAHYRLFPQGDKNVKIEKWDPGAVFTNPFSS
jgi:hypothetical protein